MTTITIERETLEADIGSLEAYEATTGRKSAVLAHLRAALAAQPAQGSTFVCAKCGVDRFKKPCGGNYSTCPTMGTAALAAQPAEPQQEPVAWMVFWGLGKMQPHYPPFKTRQEAEMLAERIKSYTEIRPLYAAQPAPAAVPPGYALVPIDELANLRRRANQQLASTQSDWGPSYRDDPDRGPWS